MNKRVQVWTLIVAMTVFFTGPSQAAEDVSLLKDMTSVIALLGLPAVRSSVSSG